MSDEFQVASRGFQVYRIEARSQDKKTEMSLQSTAGSAAISVSYFV